MKKLLRIHSSSAMHWVGNGFPVKSVFDYNGLGRELSPFLLLDHAAPYEFKPGAGKRGVDAHPHKGFETVTLAYQGELEHRDSSGGGGRIGPGDVQWMTAAGGIVHSEFHSPAFVKTGGMFEMVQLWVNLPAKHKNAPAGYQTLLKGDIPVAHLPGDAGELRVIAGEFEGRKGPAKTFTPINVWDAKVQAETSFNLPLPAGHNAAVLVLSGLVTVAGEARADAGQLAIFSEEGEGVEIRPDETSRLLILTGEPIREPIVGHGPFVMNTRAEIQQAFADFQRGAMGSLDS